MVKLIDRFLCWIGFHDYRVGFGSEDVEKDKCRRCGVTRTVARWLHDNSPVFRNLRKYRLLIRLTRNPLLITLLGLGVAAIIFLFGEYLGGEVSSGAGIWLGGTMVTLFWVTFKWIWGDWSKAPGAIKISGAVIITAMVGWTTYLLLQWLKLNSLFLAIISPQKSVLSDDLLKPLVG